MKRIAMLLIFIVISSVLVGQSAPGWVTFTRTSDTAGTIRWSTEPAEDVAYYYLAVHWDADRSLYWPESGGTEPGWNESAGRVPGYSGFGGGGVLENFLESPGVYRLDTQVLLDPAKNYIAYVAGVTGGWAQSSSSTSSSYHNPRPDPPLLVSLSSFTAEFSNGHPVLNWTTQSETDNLGFNLYRSENENGFENEDFIQLNSVLIDGMGTTTVPTNYSFADEYPNIESHTYYYWLQSVSTSNELELYGPVSIEIPAAGQLPTMTILSTNYPNPFNPETTIAFSIKENETGILSIYNLKGQGILKESFEAGNHQYHWNAEGLASGIYLYKLSSPTTNITRKMLLLK